MTTPTRGYTATKDQLLSRLKRTEGQVRRVAGDDELPQDAGRAVEERGRNESTGRI